MRRAVFLNSGQNFFNLLAEMVEAEKLCFPALNYDIKNQWPLVLLKWTIIIYKLLCSFICKSLLFVDILFNKICCRERLF